MSKHVPHYVENLVAESGDVKDELLLALVEATEEQTSAIERVAEALEALAGGSPAAEPIREGSYDEYLERAEEIRRKYGWVGGSS